MSSAAGSARLTPYEIGIPGREFAERSFARIRKEASEAGVESNDPGAFIQLGEVSRTIRSIYSEDQDDALHRFGAFVFQAYHFHAEGEPLYVLESDVAPYLAERSFESHGWDGRVPSRSGYLQLPRHLFWSAREEEEHAEPLDGIFWASTSSATLSLLVALGVRTGRPGISVSELPPVPLADAINWADQQVRVDADDFAPELPGGDLGGLYTVGTLGEVLKLLGRCFAHMARPGSVGNPEISELSEDTPRGGTAPIVSRLPFRRISMIEP